MKVLLRSTFIAQPSDNKDLFLRNFLAFEEANLDFDFAEDSIIWTYIKEFVRSHNHVPEASTLRVHFDFKKEETVLARLDHLLSLPPVIHGDFISRLEEKAGARRNKKVADMIKQTASILETGVEIKQGRDSKLLKGPYDAVHYFLEESHDVVAPTLGARLSGEITRDGADFLKEYERVETDPLAGIGQHTGIVQMDAAFNGAKRYELWIHAAFTGHMKSTLMLNWAYNQAIHGLHSNLVFSLEMPYTQVRRILYSIHSSHEKFRSIRFNLGLQKTLNATVGIPYECIRDGTLNEWHPNARKFLFEYVEPDFNGISVIPNDDPVTGRVWPPPSEYGKIFIEVPDPDKSDFTLADLRHKAELIYSKMPFQMIFIDHLGLMSPRKWVNSTTERLNEVIRDTKRLAMSFNKGQGIATVGLFQLNREGYKEALKRKEKTGMAYYDLTALSYANECCVEGTLIPTDKGLIPIEKVSVGGKSWASYGWKNVTDNFNQGDKAIWRTTLDNGAYEDTTKDHRIRVLENGFVNWKSIQELKAGDWIIATKGTYKGSDNVPTLPSLIIGPYEKPNGEQGVPLKTPSVMTMELAYLLGAWDGDGRVHPKGLGFTGNRKEVVVRDAIRTAFLSCFGHPIGLQESPSRKGSFDLCKWSQPLKRWFEDIAGERGVCVPDVVLQSPEMYVLEYLKGLFDTDGYINSVGICGLSSKSEKMMRQVQLLLSLFGMESYLFSHKNYLKVTNKTYGGWTLRLKGRVSKEIFSQKINFREPWKKDRLEKSMLTSTKRKVTGKYYPVSDLVLGLIESHLKYSMVTEGKVKGRLFQKTKIRENKLVPEGLIRYLIEVLTQQGVIDTRLNLLKIILNLWHCHQVVSVQELEKIKPVYDLQVSGDHEYQTGMLLSHNCERSADIVTASWIDSQLINQNRVQFQCMKSRDQKPFEIFLSRVEWPCRRILTCYDMVLSQSQKEAAGKEIDKDSEKLSELLNT